MKKVKVDFLSRVKACEFEGNNYIGKLCHVVNTTMGYGSYLSNKVYLNGVKIGRFTSIGANVSLIFGRHPINENISTHPCFYRVSSNKIDSFVTENKFDEFIYVDNNKKIRAIIGSDVWIGEGVKILEGIKISHGSIIASGSIVTKDTEEYGIYAGIPAKLIKYRFSEKTIEKLREIKWWDWPIEEIKKNAYLFSDIEGFLRNFNENYKELF